MRITVISPSVDRRHGTERAVAELIERLAADFGDQVDLYAQRVADIEILNTAGAQVAHKGAIRWQPIGQLSGPHIVRFLGWLWLNHKARRKTLQAANDHPSVVFSPGINALDADLILVHAVFHRLAELQAESGRFGPRSAHRWLYYSLLCKLERRIYCDRRVTLAAVSSHTAGQLAHYFGRQDVSVIPNGVDAQHFSPRTLVPLREPARKYHLFSAADVVLALIGNDWRNKGLRVLLNAVAICKHLSVRLLVVGNDEPAHFRSEAQRLGIDSRVRFLRPAEDVRTIYAAADVLVAPSLEDSFNLPVLEAMACGVPVVVSPRAGISEWLNHGFDALLLKDPHNVGELADFLCALATNSSLRQTLAHNAIVTAGKFSWGQHVSQLRALLETVVKKKAAYRKEN